MERRNLALLCAGVVCFWLFALAFGTAQGRGLRIQPAVQTQAEPAAQTLTVTPPQLTLPCRAAILIDQTSGAVLYEIAPLVGVTAAGARGLIPLGYWIFKERADLRRGGSLRDATTSAMRSTSVDLFVV